MLELTSLSISSPAQLNAVTAQVGEAYPTDLTYRDVEFFDTVYMDAIIPAADKALEIEDNGHECYLGYLPKEDLFISAWDTFGDETNPAGPGIVYIRVTVTEGKCQAEEVMGPINASSNGGLFYSAGYKDMHKIHNNLLDIRLD
jgi:hypothetical protein